MSESELAKLRKVMPDSMPEELEALDRDGLMRRIADSESNIREAESSRDDNEQLGAARELVKELAGPYRDAIKVQRAIQRYALLMLEQRGA